MTQRGLVNAVKKHYILGLFAIDRHMPLSLLPTYCPDRLSRLQQLSSRSEGPGKQSILAYALNGFPVLAEVLCRAHRLLFPGDHSAAGWLGVFVWARGRAGHAERYLGKYLGQFPTQHNIRWLLSVIAEEQNNTEKALAILGTAQPQTEPGMILLQRIRLVRRRGLTEEALALTTSASVRFPDVVWPHSLQARILLDTGQTERARDIAEQSRQQIPNSPAFPLLLARLANGRGDYAEACRQELACLTLRPGHFTAMRGLLQSLDLEREAIAAASTCLDAYERAGRTSTADFCLLRRIAELKGSDPDIAAIKQIAKGGDAEEDAAFNRLLACAALGDFAAAAQCVIRMLRDGSWDQRLIAFLRIHGKPLAPGLQQFGAPGIDFLDSKLRLASDACSVREAGRESLLALARFLPEAGGVDAERALVSYICPIHRRNDIENILAQLGQQQWPEAEVIFCISNPDIAEHELSRESAPGHTHHILRYPPGMPVGYYLNRCIEKASGEYLLRFDADDLYAPEYTPYMVAFMRETGADVISMDLSSYYFADIDQTFHIRPPLPLSREGTVDAGPQRVGSGSSMCAVPGVFRELQFSETQTAGEDFTFYRGAKSKGMDVRLVPGYYHTAVRAGDSRFHTWRIDDFSLLTPGARFLGEGCITPEPGLAHGDIGVRDVYSDLFADASLTWLRELQLQEIMRSLPEPLCLVIGEDTPIAEQRGTMLNVIRGPEQAEIGKRQTWIFVPDAPHREYQLARRLGGYSVIRDIIPELLVGNRDVFRRLSGFKPKSLRARRNSFRRANKRYMILCNPRSGSEYLASLLASVDMGLPSELVREPVTALLAGGLRPGDYLPGILCKGIRGNVLGTKIVSQYLFEHLDEERQHELFEWISREKFNIVRLRRPEAESALSSYIATERNCWHQFQRPEVESRSGRGYSELELPPYNFEALARYMRELQAWSEQLDHLVKVFIPAHRVLDLDYSDIVAAPDRAVGKVGRLVGFQPLPGVQPVSITRALRYEGPELERYRARFTADWAALGNRVD